tara:strand:+ start:596 stop:1723 length:1128 start_codon:yes stop_codon:yes gene_type:complete
MSGSYCSPSHTNKITCFSNDQLIKIARTINKRSKQIIEIPPKITETSRKKLWQDIKTNVYTDSTCREDYCLLNTPDILKSIPLTELENVFRPAKPLSWVANKTQWLSTIDIRRVMKQYERKYKDFKFIGPTPIDFDSKISANRCVLDELCNINLEELITNNIYRIGVVFNLDPHYKRGSHWVSMFIDCNTGGIYFFDSYGMKPNTQIQILMERIKEQGVELIHRRKLNINNMTDTHTVARPFKIINDTTIQVEDSDLFYLNNLLYFGNCTNKSLKLLDNSPCIIAKKLKDRLYLDRPITTNKCNVAIMKSFRTFYNNRRFQYKTTECGVYSIYFIESFLHGNTYDDIIGKIVNDDEMNKRRDIYYRPNLQLSIRI